MCEKSKFFHHERRSWNWADIRWKGIPKSRNYCSHRAKTLNNPPKFQRTGEKNPKTTGKSLGISVQENISSCPQGSSKLEIFPMELNKKKGFSSPALPALHTKNQEQLGCLNIRRNLWRFPTSLSLCRQARRVSARLSQRSTKRARNELENGKLKIKPRGKIALFLDQAAGQLRMRFGFRENKRGNGSNISPFLPEG